MSEIIVIEGREARLTTGSGEPKTVDAGLLAEGISANMIRGLTPAPLPDNVKWMVQLGQLTICIVQLTPEWRFVKWLADNSPRPFGEGAIYSDRKLATPYVVLKVPFLRDRVIPRVEVFYRNEPLRSLEGEAGTLYWPNLFNVSVNAYNCTAWYCSQYLDMAQAGKSIEAGLDAVIHHLFGGGFNASSDFHEGLSTFTFCVQEQIDPRVSDVARWEDESKADPKFVLTVPWKPTGLTVKALIDRELKFHKLSPVPATAGAWGNILLRQAKPK